MIEFKELRVVLVAGRQICLLWKNGLNNIYLLSTSLYKRHLLLFEMLLNKNNYSIRSTLGMLKELSRDNRDMIAKTEKMIEN